MIVSIHLWEEKKIIYNTEPAYEGEIFIGDFKSTFIMPVSWWKLHDYRRQWKEGIERIKHDNKSCLVTSVWGPEEDPFIEMYVLYRHNEKIIIRNHALFSLLYKDLSKGFTIPFTPETCYLFVRDMIVHSQIQEEYVWEKAIDVSDLP